MDVGGLVAPQVGCELVLLPYEVIWDVYTARIELYKHLHLLLIADGYEWANDFLTTFLKKICPDGRPKFIRHSSL